MILGVVFSFLLLLVGNDVQPVSAFINNVVVLKAAVVDSNDLFVKREVVNTAAFSRAKKKRARRVAETFTIDDDELAAFLSADDFLSGWDDVTFDDDFLVERSLQGDQYTGIIVEALKRSLIAGQEITRNSGSNDIVTYTLMGVNSTETAISMLEAGKVDIIATSTPMHAGFKGKDMAFAPPYMALDVSIITSRVALTPSFDRFLRPFSVELWLCYIFLMLGAVILILMYDSFSPYGFHRVGKTTAERHTLGLSNVSFAGILTLLGRNPSPQRSWSVRVAWLGAYFMAFFILRAYTSALTGILTARDTVPRVLSWNDLKTPGVRYGIEADSWVHAALLRSTDPDVTAALPQRVPMSNRKTLMNALKAGSIDAIVTDSFIAVQYTSLPPCSFEVVGKARLQSFFSFAYATSTSELGDGLEDFMMRSMNWMQASGTINELWNSYLAPSACAATIRRGQVQQIDFEDISGFFYVFLALLGAGYVMLGVEFMVAPRRNEGIWMLRVNRALGWFGEPAKKPAPAPAVTPDVKTAAPAVVSQDPVAPTGPAAPPDERFEVHHPYTGGKGVVQP